MSPRRKAEAHGQPRGNRSLPVWKYDGEGNRVFYYPSLTQMALLCGISIMQARRCLMQARPHEGFYFSHRDDFKPPKR